MFRSARIKLTAWYLVIIMVISIFFSLMVYSGLVFELQRSLRAQALRNMSPIERQEFTGAPRSSHGSIRTAPPLRDMSPGAPLFDPELFEDARRRVALQLAYINLAILALSGMAGYFLAGRTLRPIESILEDQKRFIADASHELRTPLTALKTEIEVGLRENNLDAALAKELLHSNLEEVDKLKVLSDDLLSLSSYEKGNSREFADVSLAGVFDEAAGVVRALALEKHIEVRSSLEDVVLEAHRLSLVKLFVILLDNAIKYSPENRSVDVSVALKKNHVLIKVKDEGIGMRAGDLPYIFRRFYRADASRTKGQVPGYGLGLSIAKSIIDIHNGKVDVTSEPGKGTTFTITLPLKHQKNFLNPLA